MSAYYNEHDPNAAAWLRELIKQGHIADGVVDERDIQDVPANDLRGFKQCHFFAGIGVWSYALRLAGWPDDKPVWTGSCPCQPFSTAGRRAGTADERHLWPAWYWLIRQHRPRVVFGEQVASNDGIGWLEIVSNDLEEEDYRFGSVVFPACGVGAPHQRNRLWFVADTSRYGARQHAGELSGDEKEHEVGPTFSGYSSLDRGAAGGLAHADGRHASKKRKQRGGEHGQQQKNGGVDNVADSTSGGFGEQRRSVDARQIRHADRGLDEPGVLADASSKQREPGRIGAEGVEPGSLVGSPRHGAAAWSADEQSRIRAATTGATKGFWRDADWLFCRDGRWRPVEPGSFPLAHGAPARLGRLRGYGNAIVAQAAAAVIKAYKEIS